MFFLEITTDQIILTLSGAVGTISLAITYLAKYAWGWLKEQFKYLTTRMEGLEDKLDEERKFFIKKIDEERLRLESKLDDERDKQNKRFDGMFKELIQETVRPEKIHDLTKKLEVTDLKL